MKVKGTWYELISLNGLSDVEIVAFSRKTYKRKWKLRFEEDLVELLSKMGHRPQIEVKLVLKTLDSNT